MKVQQVFGILKSVANDVLGAVQYINTSTGLPYATINGMDYPLNASGQAIDPTTGEVVGEDYTVTPSYFVAPDLTNVVDVGKRILAGQTLDSNGFSNVYASLINHIGKVVFVDRIYKPIVPSIMRDNWEYGSVVEKIDADMPDTTYNPEWQLVDKEIYEQDRFHAPKNVRAKFWNKAVTFEIEMSFTEEQLKQSFSSANQLNSFFSMIATKIANSMTVNFANLTRATINAMVMATLYRDLYPWLSSGVYTGLKATKTVGGVTYKPTTNRCINLLWSYYQEVATAPRGSESEPILTPETAMKDPEFIRYAVYKMALISKRLQDISVLFNIGGKQRFTPKDKQHFIMLAEFASAASVFLQSDTFHKELVELPKHDEVNYWLGTGNEYDLKYTGRIGAKASVTADGETYTEVLSKLGGDGENQQAFLIGVIFDEDAMGINNEKQKTTSHYNAKGDFVNNYYKAFARYFNDHDENCVVFYVA